MSTTIRAFLLALAFCSSFHTLAATRQAHAPVSTVPACSWDRPGVDPFMGDLVAAVDHFEDIPPAVRDKLKSRMQKRDYDDLVSIRRDTIDGQAGHDYDSTISQMHFGTHRLCRSVTRQSWTSAMEERGLVYCEQGECLLVPTVCRNLSRVHRRPAGGLAALPTALPEGLPPLDWFGPTGAGMPADPGDPGVAPAADGFAGPLASFASLGAAPMASAALPVGSVGTLGAPGSRGAGLRTDAVVAAIPEPGTWALMIAGLLALAWRCQSARRPRAP